MELFDLKSDPLEKTDRAEHEPERVAALSELLDRVAEHDR
jgi:hypothetical protein